MTVKVPLIPPAGLSLAIVNTRATDLGHEADTLTIGRSEHSIKMLLLMGGGAGKFMPHFHAGNT